MAKDRPWNRNAQPAPEPESAPDAPVPEDLRLAGLEIHDMTDDEVRRYCLVWARHFLVRYDLIGRRSDDDLDKASRYAQIAQAFRPGPDPTQQQPIDAP
ncbi:hypothetical protein STRCI_008094 [Streptomyces cinnabarinus]|uniref:Uncharacterized protein n=1 Tax=Streptomyces cinnabarinus TaxID=67287 RepID=A0ABY7KU73_9ACTN|nr:hypothetical protein [Streptomyces cinnabarinus]WAZ26511.1 hypothetical protein STRCI_008094 [Streptomyces cinnabarinus]